MSELAPLPAAIACPRCLGALRTVSVDRIECAGCTAAFPVFAGIPWLYRDVAGSRAQWAATLQLFRDELQAEHGALEAALEDPDLLPGTQDRLSRRRAGAERLGAQVFSLLEPFAFSTPEARAASEGPLPKDRIPSQQHMGSYLETAFRDWCWGEDETRTSTELIEASLARADGEQPGRTVLVLGGGAGRLSHEIAQRGDWAGVLQLDLNPLLTRIGSLASQGESVVLTEMPGIPRGMADVSVEQTLQRPGGGPTSPLHYLLGDAFAPPIAEASVGLLVTPWFIDILPDSFRRVARRFARLLAPGARWISFGPLSFEGVSVRDRYTPDEIVEVLGEAGFTAEMGELKSVSYLHSPHGMARRGEEVFVFDALRQEAPPPEAPFAFYPSWMTEASESVPALPVFEQRRNEHVFDLEILKCIDGEHSIDQIVETLSDRYEIEPARCRASVNRFFAKLYEEETGL